MNYPLFYEQSIILLFISEKRNQLSLVLKNVLFYHCLGFFIIITDMGIYQFDK